MTGTAGSPPAEPADGAVRKCLEFAPQGEEAPERPPYSYARLTAMAIDASAEKRCTVAAIYMWIMDRFPYYRQGKPWWKVSAGRRARARERREARGARAAEENAKGGRNINTKRRQNF